NRVSYQSLGASVVELAHTLHLPFYIIKYHVEVKCGLVARAVASERRNIAIDLYAIRVQKIAIASRDDPLHHLSCLNSRVAEFLFNRMLANGVCRYQENI